ncbi:hypothetical protein BGZ65_011035 [Modicella reniformis]|uniref:Uncharacterized protein n=1 Tax=Modicella reniformis TaxID=1440133 RepID=A0A9P6IMB6_9FUNG|nr:hypothetical protein BGZ65_011035 [Modicella reniformis]
MTRSATSPVLGGASKQSQQVATTTLDASTASVLSEGRLVITEGVVGGLALSTSDDQKITSMPTGPQVLSEQQNGSDTTPDNYAIVVLSEKDKEEGLSEVHESSTSGQSLNYDQEQSVVTVYRESDGLETSYYSQRPDGSLVEHRSYVSDSQLDPELYANDGVYLNSTTEFFPVEDQDEQVYLEEYADEIDEFPAMQLKVSKLQKQVREMRKFMRGLVQLQIEQYEPATILIQAWWRGCLVRRELRRQMVFSWHKNPKRNVKPLKYLTRTELLQSCALISVPKASILVTEDLGAHKETIAIVKLQAAFRSYLVRRRLQAYREGMKAAKTIQACWRGYWTRNLDTRLGLEQLRFRNVKVQKAFGRVSIKLQYLQGRILALEENSLPMHEAQEEVHKDLEEMADQMDALRQDLEQGLKQLDEQVSEEKEQTTIELRGLTERIQKLEEELKSVRSSNTNIEKQVKSLTLELPANTNTDTGKSDQEEDDDYEVQYDEDGNRIEKPPKKTCKRSSVHEQHQEQSGGSGARRTSTGRIVIEIGANGAPMQMVESPVPMPQQLHRGSVGSIHSQGHTRTLSLNSQPPPSPSQAFPRSFSASYSPTITNASVLPEGGSFPNGSRPHSIAYSGASSSGNNPPRSLTMDSNQLYRFHPVTNQFVPLSPSAAPTNATGSSFPGTSSAGTKNYVTVDDFEYMQAEVDTLRVNNDRLEGAVRELTIRLNSLASNMGQFYPG